MKRLNNFKRLESSNRNLVGAIATMLVLAGGCIEPPSGSSVDNHEMGADMKMDMSEDMQTPDMDQDQGVDMELDMGVDLGDLDMGVDLGTDMEADMSDDMQALDMDRDQGVDMNSCTKANEIRETIMEIKTIFDEIDDNYSFLSEAPAGLVRGNSLPTDNKETCDGNVRNWSLVATDNQGNIVSAIDQDAEKFYYKQAIQCAGVNSTECVDISGGNQLAECEVFQTRIATKTGTDLTKMFEVTYTTSPNGENRHIVLKEFADCNYSTPSTCGIAFEQSLNDLSLYVYMPMMEVIVDDQTVCEEDLDAMIIRDEVINMDTIPNY